MAMPSSPERELCRLPVMADWLGSAPELVVTDRRLVLRDRGSGAEARVPLGDLAEVRWRGDELGLRRHLRGAQDFAGVAWDGWYHLRLTGAPDAETLAAALARLRRGRREFLVRPRWGR
jgi:hypothetical protein